MKKKRSAGGARLISLAAVFIAGAFIIRFLSSGATEQYMEKCMSRLGGNSELLRYAMSNETQLFEGSDISGRILGEVFAETAAVPGAADESEAEETVITEEAEDITEWIYTPGGGDETEKLPIKEITINPTSPKGYVTLGNIFVKNDSTKGIDLKWLLGAKLPFSLTGKGPHVLIVHTHGSESFFPQGKDTYSLTDVERTEDKRYNVVRLGDELAETLKNKGISVVHDRNIYDSPSYNGSYTRTLSAIGNHLKKSPSIKVVIDVHRDSMTTKEGVKYKTVAEVGGKKVAQMMLVMSTGESGLPHPNWAENLKLAVKLQNALASKYPGIMRPMNLRKERFNMHATTGSMLVEVGTSANSLDEALGAVKLLGEELSEILKTAK